MRTYILALLSIESCISLFLGKRGLALMGNDVTSESSSPNQISYSLRCRSACDRHIKCLLWQTQQAKVMPINRCPFMAEQITFKPLFGPCLCPEYIYFPHFPMEPLVTHRHLLACQTFVLANSNDRAICSDKI